MTVNINGTTGVSLIQTGAVPSGTTMANVAVSNVTFSGATSFSNTNVSITGASSYLNINGINISPYSGMMKNRIINGDFRIDQRFAGTANNNYAGPQYIVDRWYGTGNSPARYRSQQNNTNGPGTSATQTATGFANYFGANVISSNASYGTTDAYYYSQPIEGLNISDLGWGTANATPVTLSFWVYSSVPGSHSGTIANGLANRSYPFTYTINTANTWQYQTITIPGDTSGTWFTNTSIGMYVVLNMGAGSTYTTASGNSWQSSWYQYVTGVNQVQSYANGSLYFTGVQLEEGSRATAFEFRHYGTELQLCQRYFQIYANTYVPVVGQAYIMLPFMTPLRIVPTLGGGNAGFTSGIYLSNNSYLIYQTTAAIVSSWFASAELQIQN